MAGALSAMIAAIFSGGVTSDPFFEYTTLLLPGNGTNGAQNNTFLDGSTNNFTITRNGNTTQGTFSPFSQTGWGNYFDGTNDYLTTTTNLSTNQFTIECWAYFENTATGTQQVIVAQYIGSPLGRWALVVQGSGYPGFSINGLTGGNLDIVSGSTIQSNQWHHFAVTRDGSNNFTLYVNGISVGSGARTGSAPSSSVPVTIGTLETNILFMKGYISNLRIVTGAALYTGNFTPPTSPLTTTVSSGTVVLLTCQSNRFIDNSSNNFTVTPTNGPIVVAFSPFNPTASWSAATYGGSGYFDGSGDYLSVASNAAFALGTGDFTIEFWFYPTTGSARNITFPVTGAPIFYMNGSRQLQFETYGAPPSVTTTNTLNLNDWNHCAVSRASGTVRVFVNGVIGVTSTAFSATNFIQSSVNIGTDAGTNFATGYMANVRIVKGTAVYTGNFTPPTAPITNAGSTSAAAYPSTTNVNTSFASSATSLLLNFTNAGIYNATSKNDLETVGNAQISTAISAKWGSGSMYFDGTGDWLDALASNQLFNLSSGDWTIEAWIYRNASGAAHTILTLYNTAGSNSGLTFYVNASNQLVTDNGVTAALAAGTVASGQWVYVAIVRSGSTTTGYINGSSVGTTAQAPSASQYARVGALASGASVFNGYIQDLRITKGYARTITTPTAAFPTL
jgi:hypothetical protein